MSDNPKEEAWRDGFIGASDEWQNTLYHSDALVGKIAGDQFRAVIQREHDLTRRATSRERLYRFEEEVGARRKHISTPQMSDYGGETPAYCQAIEEYHAKCLEVMIAIMEKHDMTNFGWLIKTRSTINELRKPWPQQPPSFSSVAQEMDFELEIRTRSIPKRHLLFPGEVAGGDYEQFLKDKLAYEKRAQHIRDTVHAKYAAALNEEKDRTRAQHKIEMITGGVTATSSSLPRKYARYAYRDIAHRIAATIGFAAAIATAVWYAQQEISERIPHDTVAQPFYLLDRAATMTRTHVGWKGPYLEKGTRILIGGSIYQSISYEKWRKYYDPTGELIGYVDANIGLSHDLPPEPILDEKAVQVLYARVKLTLGPVTIDSRQFYRLALPGDPLLVTKISTKYGTKLAHIAYSNNKHEYAIIPLEALTAYPFAGIEGDTLSRVWVMSCAEFKGYKSPRVNAPVLHTHKPNTRVLTAERFMGADQERWISYTEVKSGKYIAYIREKEFGCPVKEPDPAQPARPDRCTNFCSEWRFRN